MRDMMGEEGGLPAMRMGRFLWGVMVEVVLDERVVLSCFGR